MKIYDNEFTKNENQLIMIMLIGGLLISIMTIIPTSGDLTKVDYIMIVVNVFYWAMTIIMLNSVEHKATRRALHNSKSVEGKEQ